MHHKIIHLKRKITHNNSLVFKLMLMFWFGVFVGAIGVILVLNFSPSQETSIKQNNPNNMAPVYPPSFENVPQSAPQAASPSAKRE